MRLALAIAVLAVGCQRPQPRPSILEPSTLRKAFAVAVTPNYVAPGLRMIYGRTSCTWGGPNPVVLTSNLPRVGEELVVRWCLSYVAPAPSTVDSDGVQHAPLVALLASTNPLPSPMSPGVAAPGCWLLVNPDLVIAPAPETWLTYEQSTGLVTMRWTPTAGMEGKDLYTQLLVVMPEANQLGLVSSAGLHVHVGSARP